MHEREEMIYEIDHPIDERTLKREADVREGYEPFVDPKSGTVIERWLIKRDVTGYARVLTRDFEEILDTNIKPRFYIQERGFTLPFHRDRGTTCAINFVLSDTSDPIEFRDRSYTYKSAIIDVTREHQVTATTGDRVLFKMSIFDLSFDEVVRRYDSAH